MASARRSMSTFTGHGAEHADGEPRPGERMPPHHLLGEAELAAHIAHFVLEQLAQRLDQRGTSCPA
jgi:hypothetical protein